MRQLPFEKILYKNYMYLILTAAILISVFTAAVDVSTTLNNEKKNMQDSLKQAQININTPSQMIEDYLTLTHSNSQLQKNLRKLYARPSASLLTAINEKLFSVDLFKKSLDSMQIFAYEEASFLPAFSDTSQYGNAIFSAESVSDADWFQQTLDSTGKTYWFTDDDNFRKPTLCAARVLYDTSNPEHILGVLKANVSVEKMIRHLKTLSFGKKGYTFISTATVSLYVDADVSTTDLPAVSGEPEHSSLSHLVMTYPVITDGWHVTGVIDNRALYRSTFQNLLWILLIFILVLIAAALLSRENSRRISAPVNQLCEHMLKLETCQKIPAANCTEIRQLYDTYNKMLEKNEALIKSREDALLKFKQAEMAALQSQMNPHFIYNTLESINALISIGDTEHASLMTTGLGNFLRSSLNNGNNYISLQKELEQVISYIQIQKFRYANQIELRLNVPAVIPDYRIIKLILQPLVENCILHGFKDLDETGIITIGISETDTDLILSVADNGFGSDIEMLNYLVRQKTLYREDNVNFYCIQNVFHRLYNCYGENSSLLYTENADGGVTATIRIAKKVL